MPDVTLYAVALLFWANSLTLPRLSLSLMPMVKDASVTPGDMPILEPVSYNN